MSVKECIVKNGAATVYNAAVARLGGDRKPLERLGLKADNLGEANRIMTEAFKHLSVKERRADYMSMRHALGRIGRPPIGNEIRKRHQVMIEPAVAQKLRILGGGNLSRGIAIAADGVTDNQGANGGD